MGNNKKDSTGNNQPRQYNRQGQEQNRQRREQNPHRRQQTGRHQSRQQPQQAEDGIDRRIVIGGIGIAVVGGWFLLTGNGPDNNPEEVVRTYYTALANDDMDTINEVLHSDSPLHRDVETAAGFIIDAEVDEIESVETEGDTAQVRARASIQTPFGGESERISAELRLEEDKWRMWDV